ncbi:hypothetical protein BDV59DRAFT_202203 [Aspergillus ambiguus]|uniref:uncharacterized protein n=1 Tax=Aspergillus ambiguus TaxID=176160 RepID=UPI003CCCEA42
MGWCERFFDDPGAKSYVSIRRDYLASGTGANLGLAHDSFTYTGNIVGLDVPVLRSVLTSLIRSLNYQGTIHISGTLTNKSFVVTSHWIDRMRNNGFVYFFCILMQVWVLTWPVIWWVERRNSLE